MEYAAWLEGQATGPEADCCLKLPNNVVAGGPMPQPTASQSVVMVTQETAV
jgi:hypothetical protein